jgi:hypothetical protein
VIPASFLGEEAVAGVPLLLLYVFATVVGLLSIRPVLNLLSSQQAMNSSFDPFHLVNTYGAFGSITRARDEIIIEGTNETAITPSTQWYAYEFKAKPGDPDRKPPQVTPYHYKIDWQMWFAAMSEYRDHPWILNLIAKFLRGDPDALSLIAKNPFPDKPPHYIRASLFEYHFSRATGRHAWWFRRKLGEYLPPLSLDNQQFMEILKERGWLE